MCLISIVRTMVNAESRLLDSMLEVNAKAHQIVPPISLRSLQNVYAHQMKAERATVLMRKEIMNGQLLFQNLRHI